MRDVFAIVVCHEHGRPVVRLSGDFDLLNAPTLADALNALSEVGEHRVLLDLSDVTFIDSSGVAALLEALHRGVQVEIADSSPIVRRVLEVSGVAELFPRADGEPSGSI